MEARIGTDSALQVDAINLEESGFQAVNELQSRGVEFDAIVAASDLIAIGALRALQESGIDVPRQVSVVGFDDIPAASLTNPPLTTVMQDTRRAGELLVETLLRQIAGESGDQRGDSDAAGGPQVGLGGRARSGSLRPFFGRRNDAGISTAMAATHSQPSASPIRV